MGIIFSNKNKPDLTKGLFINEKNVLGEDMTWKY